MKKKKCTLISCNLLFIFLLYGCSYKRVEFDTNSGKTNLVKVGDKFRITLTENHQKNYYWALKENSNKRSLDYLGSVFHGDKSGEVDFNFEALQAGEAILSFNLNHYNDSTETKVFKVDIVK